MDEIQCKHRSFFVLKRTKMQSMLEIEMKQLDQEFKHAITAIKPHILQLRDSNQIVLCRLWIEKLIKCDVKDKHLRNIYMDQLCSNLKAQQFGPPFCDLPWQGPLSNIPTTIHQQISYSDSQLWTTDDECSRFSEKSSYNTTTDEERHSDTTTVSQRSSYRHHNRRRRTFPKGGRSRSMTSIKVLHSAKKPHKTMNMDSRFKTRSNSRKSTDFEELSNVNTSVTSLERVSHSRKSFQLKKGFQNRDTSTTSLSTVRDAEKVSLENSTDLQSDDASKLDSYQTDETFFSDDFSKRKRCTELLREIQQLQESNDGLKMSLNREKNLLESICTEKIELQQEIARSNEKLSRMKELEKGARGKREAFVVEINEQLTFQARRVRQALESSSRLERELNEILDNSDDGKFLKVLENEWNEKHRKLSARKQETLRRAEWDRRSATDNLQSQLDASRQKCIERRDRRAKLEKKFQQHFHSLRAHLHTIRDQHTHWKAGFDQRANGKVANYETLIEKLKKERCRIVRHYEIRLERMQQTKGMELWVKKFDNYLHKSDSEDRTQLERCLDEMQQQFHKQYSDVIDKA